MAIRRRRVALLAMGIGAAGCACTGWEPYEPHQARDVQQGGGILTGSDGELGYEVRIPSLRGTDEDAPAEDSAEEKERER